MVPFDVQLWAASSCTRGRSRKWRPAKGKTLVATMPIYLNALPGRGVHLVTVNDYLAKRDSHLDGTGLRIPRADRRVHPDLDGLDPAPEAICVRHHVRHQQRIRVRLPPRQHGRVDQRILSTANTTTRSSTRWTRSSIDEARTPLIISGPVKSEDHKFYEMKPHVDRLVERPAEFRRRRSSPTRKSSWRQAKNEEAGVLLLRAYRGLPKHPRLTEDLLRTGEQEARAADTEIEYLRDQSSAGCTRSTTNCTTPSTRRTIRST